MYRETSSRAQELRNLCDYLESAPNFSHFTPYTLIDMYPSEMRMVKRKYASLRVDKASKIPNSRLISCAIYKR